MDQLYRNDSAMTFSSSSTTNKKYFNADVAQNILKSLTAIDCVSRKPQQG